MKVLFTIIFAVSITTIFAGASPAADRVNSATSEPALINKERVSGTDMERPDHEVVETEVEKEIISVAPQKRDGDVKTYVTLAVLFNTLGLIGLILSLIFVFSTIAAWPFFIGGIIFLILGSVFWSMARRARRENRRERRRDKVRRRRRR
jgi:uncharacterized membrane protein YqjE